jgi:hypothetical protein
MTSNSALFRQLFDAGRRPPIQPKELFAYRTAQRDTRAGRAEPTRRPGRLLSLLIHILGPF